MKPPVGVICRVTYTKPSFSLSCRVSEFPPQRMLTLASEDFAVTNSPSCSIPRSQLISQGGGALCQ